MGVHSPLLSTGEAGRGVVSHFTDERTEAQRQHILPNAHSKGQWEGHPNTLSIGVHPVQVSFDGEVQSWGSGTGLSAASEFSVLMWAVVLISAHVSSSYRNPLSLAQIKGFFKRRTLT